MTNLDALVAVFGRFAVARAIREIRDAGASPAILPRVLELRRQAALLRGGDDGNFSQPDEAA